MRDELFSLGQRTEKLLDRQRDMQGYWNDAMSRKIRERFLHHHESSSKDMLLALKNQQDALSASSDSIKQADAHRREAEKASEDVEKHLKYAQGELNKALKYMDQVLKMESHVRNQMNLVQELIEKANLSGA
jgi:hypothetical protein